MILGVIHERYGRGMDTLLAEDLLLLVLDPVKGSVGSTAPIQTLLGGAVLADLALGEHVTVTDKSGVWKKAKVHASATGSPPADPVLRDALERIAEKERSAEDLVDRLGKGLKERLGDRLVERGILERRDAKVLGLFARTRWPEANGSHERDLRGALTAVLVLGREPDARTGALIALLSAADRPHKAVDHDGISSREVKKRAKEIAKGDWAAKGVKDAITASTAAIVAVVAVSAVAASGGG